MQCDGKRNWCGRLLTFSNTNGIVCKIFTNNSAADFKLRHNTAWRDLNKELGHRAWRHYYKRLIPTSTKSDELVENIMTIRQLTSRSELNNARIQIAVSASVQKHRSRSLHLRKLCHNGAVGAPGLVLAGTLLIPRLQWNYADYEHVSVTSFHFHAGYTYSRVTVTRQWEINRANFKGNYARDHNLLKAGVGNGGGQNLTRVAWSVGDKHQLYQSARVVGYSTI